MSTITRSRNAGVQSSQIKAKKGRLPSFQQLRLNQQCILVSSSTSHKTPHLISHTSTDTTDTMKVDDDTISTTPIVSLHQQQQQNCQHQRHGSDSLSQWEDMDASMIPSYNSSNFATPQNHRSITATKELNIALKGANDLKGAYTGTTRKQQHIVTPSSRRSTRSSPPTTLDKSMSYREASPEPSITRTNRRLFMCGAVDITNELKDSFQDVSATMCQIVSTVRHFGPDDKDAVKDTLKDAQYFMKRKVLGRIISEKRFGGDGDSQMQYDESEDFDPKRRDQGANVRVRRSKSTTEHSVQPLRKVRDVEEKHNKQPHENEELVYDNSVRVVHSSELNRVFKC